jgi:hypothetical protein
MVEHTIVAFRTHRSNLKYDDTLKFTLAATGLLSMTVGRCFEEHCFGFSILSSENGDFS